MCNYTAAVNVVVVLVLQCLMAVWWLFLMSACHSIDMNVCLVAIRLLSFMVSGTWSFVGRKFCRCCICLYARMTAQQWPQTVVFSVLLSASSTANSMLSLNFITQWKTYWGWVGNTTAFDFSLLHRFVHILCSTSYSFHCHRITLLTKYVSL